MKTNFISPSLLTLPPPPPPPPTPTPLFPPPPTPLLPLLPFLLSKISFEIIMEINEKGELI